MNFHVQKSDFAPFAFQISSASHPKTLDDLNSYHKDSMYELVSATREAYLMKILANKLASNVTKSSNVRDMAHLIADSSRELERSLRMAACISNAPVSTTYPYLPVMPTKLTVPLSQNPSSGTVPSTSPSTTPGSVPLASPLQQTIGSSEFLIIPTWIESDNPRHPYHKWVEFI